MPVEELPFNEGQASGLEPLAGASALSVNAMRDVAGTIRARPGIAAWDDFPSAIPNASAVRAMVPFGSYLVYVTEDRKLWAWTTSGVVTALSDSTAATQLDGAEAPNLMSLRTKVVAVGGALPQKWTGTGLSARLAGSPPLATHVSGIATRLVLKVTGNSGIFQWSGLGDSGHETWDALNYAEAESRPDPLVALSDNTNELYMFGSETLQVFSPDPVIGFATGRAMNIGLLAPQSVIRIDDLFAFLDRERRFILTDGRSFDDNSSVISKPIEASLRAMGTVSDCWGFRLRTDRWDACVWMFPTAGKGWIWDRRNNQWSEWRGWDATHGGYAAPAITSAAYWPDKNLFLVGLSTGQIAKLSQSAYDDLGTTMKVELLTGFVDHGTDNQKKSIQVSFTFKRGQVPFGDAAPPVHISWRDDLGPFSPPRVYTLGEAGSYDPDIQLRSSGVYRRRQWKIEYTTAADFTFTGAREDFLPLES